MDWKPGSIGVPMFHCLQCMRRWLKLGHIPESCSEPEDLTEGPAMCITDQSNDSRMIVGGALGCDGKPVRIKVELPVNIKKMLKKEQKKKRKGSTRKAHTKSRDGKSNDRLSTRSGKEEHAFVFSEEEDDFLDSNSSDEDGDLLDLPDSLRTYILKKAARQMTPSKSLRHLKSLASERRKSVEFTDCWSMSDFTTSSLSSFASKVDSEEFTKYLESGDSSDVFLSDYDYTQSSSQLDMDIGGENESKPIKRRSIKGEVETMYRPSSDTVEMPYSSGNGTHPASTKSTQSKVRNGKRINKRRSKSFPESMGLESSSTLLPPIWGAGSSQNSSKYSTRKQRREPNYPNNLTKNGDEALDLSGLEGHSFHSLANSSSDLFIHDEVEGSSRLNDAEREGTGKDKNSRKRTSHRYDTRSVTRSKARKQSQHDDGDKAENENELHLPDIFDGSRSPVNPSNAVPGDHQNSEKPPSRDSQSVRLPQLKADRGVMAQQAAEDWISNNGEVVLSNGATTDRRRNHGNSEIRLPQTRPKDDLQSNSAAMIENEHREDFDKTQSHAQFVITDASQSALSARTSRTRGSLNTPLAHTENNQKKRSSRLRVSQATLQEDVDITVGRSNGSRLRPPSRQRRGKQSNKETLSLHRLPENNLNKTLSSHLPENPSSTRRPSMEMSTEDNIPRRIGHKLIKKKKGDDRQRDAAMHNSKDIGNIIEGTAETADGNKQSPSSRRPSLIAGLVEEFNSFAQSPLTNSLKANLDVPYSNNNWTTSNNNMVTPGVGSVSGGGATSSAAKLRPISGGMGYRQAAANYTPASTLLQEKNGNTSVVLPPVHLKPLDPTQMVNLDPSSTAGIQQPLQVIGGQLQEGAAIEGGMVETAVDGEKEGAGEEGLEAIMEESEPSESEDEYFDIRPIPELKPVSTLSFSSNQFSYFPMGRAHKQAYQAVRQKAMGKAPPAKWGRSHRTPAKIAKRRKR